MTDKTQQATELNKSLRSKAAEEVKNEGADSTTATGTQESGAPAVNLSQAGGDQQNNQQSTAVNTETSEAGNNAGADTGTGAAGTELNTTLTQEETSVASETAAAITAPVEAQQTEVAVLPVHLASLKDRLDQYLAVMGPGRSPSEAAGRQQQLSLWRSIQLVLRQEGTAFTESMNYLLEFIHANRSGAFSERLLFRFIPELNLGRDDRVTFERLLSTFIDTADASARAHTIKQIDLKKVLAKLNDARVEQRLLDFYRIA